MPLASIQTILSVYPHPNADSLDIAKVLGWQTIIRRGSFQEGDRCVFVEIDSILPDAPWAAFLKSGDSRVRIKNAKIRGLHSQGICFDLNILPEILRSAEVGTDVTEILGVEKYIKYSAESSTTAGGLPEGIYPTDENNGLSNLKLVETILAHQVDVTLKLDGSSMTVIWEGGKMRVCSRRLEIKEGDCSFWRAAKKLNLNNLDGDWVIQGELMGPKIQDNQLKLTEPQIFVYQARPYHDTLAWVSLGELEGIAERIGAKTVPFLVSGRFSLDKLKDICGAVVLPNKKPAEGIVVRPSNLKSLSYLSPRPIGFKLINPNYAD